MQTILIENAVQRVHDPCIIREKDWYYVFATGRGIPVRRSRDLRRWELAGRVFAEDVPEWARDEIPGSSSLWAPDIAHFNGRYHLYYSVSTFGKNRSAIGLATNVTLDREAKEYAWKDEGKVFESFPRDDFNAIDANVLRIGKDRMVMTLGSFWSGIKLVKMNPGTGRPYANETPVSLVRRLMPGDVEAPFLIQRKGFFYLFFSSGFCCRGVKSTYDIRVGRAERVEGPYKDRDKTDLLEAGGTVVLSTQGRYIGPGHCAVLEERGRHLLVHHFYDGDSNGVPTLQVRPLRWDRDDWPIAESPLT